MAFLVAAHDRAVVRAAWPSAWLMVQHNSQKLEDFRNFFGDCGYVQPANSAFWSS